jgi:tetratricopeptide (TPR) repeat protein
MLGRFNEALRALDPLTADDDYSVDYHRGVLYLLLNDRKEASRRFEMNRLLLEKNIRSNPKNAYWHLQMSLVLARLGRKDSALEYQKKGLALDPDDHFEAARLAAILGRNDEALDRLELAARKGFKNYIWMKIHPDLQSLYGHPRFEAMLARFLE